MATARVRHSEPALQRQWHAGPLLGFDLETTGVDPHGARVVAAATVRVEPDGVVSEQRSWLLDPGIEIPAAASNVHGITTERARVEGMSALVGMGEILKAITGAIAAGTPLVVFNAPYDLTLIDAEARRHGLAGVADVLSTAPVIDPLVIDRAMSRRRGKRTLAACCEYYQVELNNAHDAGADATAACLLAQRLAEYHPQVGAADIDMIGSLQRTWNADWAQSYVRWRRQRGDADFQIDASWPIRAAG